MEVTVDPIIFQIQQKGGISRIFTEILPRMCDQDASLNITLLSSGRYKQALPVHKQIQVRRVYPVERWLRPGRLWWRFAPQVKAFAQQAAVGDTKGKIWHSTYYTRPFSWKGKTVVTVADLIYERFSNLFRSPQDELVRQQQRKCILSADAVISISHATKSDIIEFYGVKEEKTFVVHLAHGHNFRILESEELMSPVSTNKPFLLYVGIRAAYKNFDNFLKSYSLWAKRKEIDIVVVGENWSEVEMKKLQELSITGQVHLLKNVDDCKLSQLYNQAAAFVYPSLYEGFGIPLLEALACGCPIVASRIPSTVEIAGDCPIYFDPTSSDDLLSALDLAVTEGRNSIRTGYGQHLAENYSWDKTAENTLAVYRAIQ